MTIHAAHIEFEKQDGSTTDMWVNVTDDRDRDVAELKARKFAERKCSRVDAFTGEWTLLNRMVFERSDDFIARRDGYKSAKAMHEAKEAAAKEKYGY